MSATDIILLACAAGLVPLAGYFAAVETSLLRLSPARIAELEREGHPRAPKLATIAADRPRYTNLLLLLRVGAEMLSTVLVAVVLYHAMGVGWLAIAVGTVVMTVVSYVLVGVGPRTIGRQHSYGLALRTAWITLLLGRIFGPLASLLILVGNAITPGHGFREGPFASEVELRELVDIAEQRGVVEHDEREMIHSVFELGDTIVREVMVPRTEVVWIEQDKLARQALALALRSGFSRIPVIGANVDDVVGLVYLKDLVRRTRGDAARTLTVEPVMRPATFVPESKPVDELLREMQARRIHMAVVIDEYGGTAGLVTIEDILEEIVGEITDEYDNERPPIEWIEDGTARVTSRLPIDDLGELFAVRIEEEDVDTVGGLLAQALGRVPIPGAEAEVHGLHLVAESAGGRRNRIDSVLVNRAAPETLPDLSEEMPDIENEEHTVDG
ncbi:MAG TPA: hemolysin family protein [Mycobacteriales bacterium]|nr:hemolysin family protein [Mycobacteriales bacterium]